MAYSINGFGTTYYGQGSFERDGSYITTKWVIAGTVPLIPLASLRVKESGRGFSRQEMYVVEELGVDWWQAVLTYAYVYICVPISLYLIIMHEHTFIEDFNVPFAVEMFFRAFPLLFVLALPHVLRWFSRRAARKRLPVTRSSARGARKSPSR
jgi:hypothetical protein